jgi:hypothetical protein
MERRHFLQLAAPAVVAAESLTTDVNLAKTAEEVEHTKTLMDQIIVAGRTDVLDRRAHANYDLMSIPEGELVPDAWNFFIEPVGAPVRGLCQWCNRTDEGQGKQSSYSVPGFTSRSFLHTNQLRANSFPPPESRTIDAVVFLFGPKMHPEDRADIATNFWFELLLNDRVVVRGPLARARVYGSIEDLVSIDTGRRKPVALDAPFSLPLIKPIHIAPMQYFALRLHGHSFVARERIELYAFLDGIADFFVQ